MKRTDWRPPAILMMILVLGGCSSGSRQTQGSGLVPSLPESSIGSALPDIPADIGPQPGPLRGSSVQEERSIGGSTAVQHNGSIELPVFLRLQPLDADDLRFAIYRVPGLSASVEFSVIDITMSELESGADYFFALADYGTGRWQLSSRIAPGSAMTVDLSGEFDGSRHVSPAGNAYIAVLVPGSEADNALVEQLDFSLSQPIGIPLLTSVSKGEFEREIFVAFSGFGGAEEYELFYKLASEPDTGYELLGVAGPGEFGSFSHKDNFPVGKEAEYGVVYEYKVRATAGAEIGEFSDPETGFRQTPQPRLFTLERALADRVELEVEIGNFPNSYTVDLFRGGKLVLDDEPLLKSSGQVLVDDFADLAEPQAGPHSYTAVVTGPGGPSLESEPVTGCIGEWSAELLLESDVTTGFYADFDEAADPGLDGPAYALFNAQAAEISYAVSNGGTLSSVMVTDAVTEMHPALENHVGVPWVAYLKTDADGGEPGVYVARGSSADPTAGGSFSSMLVANAQPLGRQVLMEEVDGRLALMFSLELGGNSEGFFYAFANIPDPQQTSDWTLRQLISGTKGNVTREYDFTELDGRPAAMYLEPDGVRFFISSNSFPLSDDFVQHFVVDSFGFTPPKAVDLFVNDGRFEATYLFGDTEEDILIGYLRQDSEGVPQSAIDWEQFDAAVLFDKRVRDVSFVIADDGIPLLVLRNADSDWPEVLRPRLSAAGNIQTRPWSYGPIFPNEPFRNIDQFLTAGIRARLVNGQVHILAESTFDEDAVVQQLHVISLGLKQP